MIDKARNNSRDNPRNWAILVTFALMGASCLATPAFTRAQAPPGPLPQTESQDAPPPPPRPQVQKPAVQPRTSIFVEWKLDQNGTNVLGKIMQQAKKTLGK